MKKENFAPSFKKEGVFIKKNSFWFRKLFLLFTFFLPLFFLPLFSQASNLSVVDVKIQGNKVIEEKKIKGVLSATSFPFSEEKIKEQMQAIYDMGYFFSVKALKETTPEGIVIVYEVKEYPVVKSVEFKNVAEDEIKKLKKVVTLEVGKPWNYKKAEESKEKILSYFKKKGYTQAKVSFSYPSEEKEEIAFVFYIEKGQKARVIEVEVSGNSFFSDAKIRSFMKTRFKKFYDPDVLKEDIKKVKDEYQKKGFYFVKISLDSLDFFDKDRVRWVRVFLKIEEGERYKMGSLSVEGNSVFSVDKIKESFGLKKGDIFNVKKVREGLRQVQRMYAEKGYLYAKVDNRLHFDREKKNVDVELLIDENTKVYVNEVKIEGNETSKERIFKHTLLLKKGDIFNVERMIESWRRLYNLGFFEKVEMRPVATDDPSLMDLVVDVKEREKMGKLLLGASYSSDVGLGGFIQFSKDNLWGEGKMLSIDWEFGKERNNYQIDYIDRWWNDTSTRIEVGLYNTEYNFYSEEEGSYSKKTTGGKISLGRPLIGNFTLFLTLKSETTEIEPIEGEEFPSDLEKGKSTYQSLKPALVWDSRVRDEAFVPYRGFYSFLAVEKSGGFLGGDVDFTKYYTEFRSYYRHGDFWRAPSFGLRLRGRWGENLPPEEEFYVGGQETLRGYELNQFRGHMVLLGTVELRIPVTQNFLGYIFLDGGKIWEDSSVLDKVGYGFGVRMNTPLGILRFDYGIGEEGSPRFYVGMGDVF